MTHDHTTAIRHVEQMRCAAMLASDTAGLDAVLDPRLIFSHATGQVDDKAAYLAKMAAGRIEYRSIEWSDEQIISLGDAAALVSGRMTSRVRVDGAEKQLDNRVLSVWSRHADGWRLLAFQSTPLKA